MRILKASSFLAAVCLFAGTAFSWAETVRVGTWKTQQTIQPFVYKQFLAQGQPVEVRSFTNPGDMKNALLAGSLDVTGTTIVQAIISASKGEPVVIVASMASKCSALVVRKESRITKASDLKGKKIGYVPGTMHQVLLLEVLAKAGLTPKDVKLIRVDFFDMLTALSRKQIDAFLSGEPYPTIAQLNGVGRVLSYPYFGDSVGTINSAMLTTRDEISRHPGRIQEVVTAHVKATAFLKKNNDAWIREAAQFGFDPKILKAAANNIDLSWDIDKNYIRHTKSLAERMKALGMIERMPNIESLFDTRFVAAAKKTLKATK
ncbi:ABC transporter substrate-binding protein [Oryzomonas japonica]|uniref:ABC transporter substrate-binding protein n=1 Tax=Oryzomonas japonica TaxID=2603858 RepID=A0A7J4ZVY6_9BACT|nr:ABC transporter substrate-binding protein [Oryzomonas japonica]KAB0667712.1 ABC transporter substrate-binding protein [Oryzomonas japonica]